MASICLWCKESFSPELAEERGAGAGFCSVSCMEFAADEAASIAHDSQEADEAYEEYLSTREWATPQQGDGPK